MITKSRLRFPKSGQREFIETAIGRAGDVYTLATLLSLSPRTIRDWRREKFLISYEAARIMSEKYEIPLSANLIIEEEFWYVSKAGKM